MPTADRATNGLEDVPTVHLITMRFGPLLLEGTVKDYPVLIDEAHHTIYHTCHDFFYRGIRGRFFCRHLHAALIVAGIPPFPLSGWNLVALPPTFDEPRQSIAPPQEVVATDPAAKLSDNDALKSSILDLVHAVGGSIPYVDLLHQLKVPKLKLNIILRELENTRMIKPWNEKKSIEEK